MSLLFKDSFPYDKEMSEQLSRFCKDLERVFSIASFGKSKKCQATIDAVFRSMVQDMAVIITYRWCPSDRLIFEFLADAKSKRYNKQKVTVRHPFNKSPSSALLRINAVNLNT